MAHGIVNTTAMACTNVDALNLVGLFTADVDNGTLVTLKKMRQATNGTITGYEYDVELAAANATGVYIVATPEVGKTLEQQVHDDIRTFYNVKGLPFDIKGFIAGVDFVEVDALAFANSTLPTAANVGQFCGVAANGKFAAPAASVASGASFRVEGLHSITCGKDEVATVILRCVRN